MKVLNNDAAQRHQTTKISFLYEITGTKTVVPMGSYPSAVAGFDTGTFTQAALDAATGTANDVLAAVYGSTAMGTDAFGLVAGIGNVQKVIAATFQVVASQGAIQKRTAVANTLASTTEIRAVETTAGNLAVQLVLTGLDALTAGVIAIDVLVILK